MTRRAKVLGSAIAVVIALSIICDVVIGDRLIAIAGGLTVVCLAMLLLPRSKREAVFVFGSPLSAGIQETFGKAEAPASNERSQPDRSRP